MIFAVNADLIRMIEGVVQSLQPFASAHEVSLKFESDVAKIEALYQPPEIVSALIKLMCRIITFTPQNYRVIVKIRQIDQQNDFLIIKIMNSGVNLTQMNEISSGIGFQVHVNGDDRHSIFVLRIPLHLAESTTSSASPPVKDHSLIKPWYSEIRKRLTSHFSNPQHIERLARQRSDQEGMFVKKVNAIIHHHLDQEGFSAEDLAKKVALSRTQLFRKLKDLTQMAPGQYIRFVRLQKAKDMLENSELNVSEVAYQVGFVSNSHFSRAFHRQFGINPSALK